MLSLAALRYRNVLAAHGGPVARIESGVFPVCGRRMYQANARLSAGLTPKRPLSLYSDADGSGTHPRVSVARHMAVSEALERWAFHSVVRSERAAEFGFDVDPSSNGMSAFPGFWRTHARRKAMLEAVERYSLISWWEGRAAGRRFDTDWPGVSRRRDRRAVWRRHGHHLRPHRLWRLCLRSRRRGVLRRRLRTRRR